MMVLGLFLLLAAAGLTLDVVFQNTSSMSVDAVGQTLTLNSGLLFVAGVAAGAIGLIGVSMLLGGMGRARRRWAARAESTRAMHGLLADRDRLTEQLDQERTGQTQTLLADRDRLAEQLDQERADRTSTTTAPSRPAHADEPAVLDLAREERAGSNPSGPDAEGPEPGAADESEPVGSGRNGVFRRRDH